MVSAITRDAQFECQRVEQQIDEAFGLDIDIEQYVAKLILAKHYWF